MSPAWPWGAAASRAWAACWTCAAARCACCGRPASWALRLPARGPAHSPPGAHSAHITESLSPPCAAFSMGTKAAPRLAAHAGRLGAGGSQAERVADVLKALCDDTQEPAFCDVEVRKDLFGMQRFVTAHRRYLRRTRPCVAQQTGHGHLWNTTCGIHVQPAPPARVARVTFSSSRCACPGPSSAAPCRAGATCQACRAACARPAPLRQ
jgi:hypothetical protein